MGAAAGPCRGRPCADAGVAVARASVIRAGGGLALAAAWLVGRPRGHRLWRGGFVAGAAADIAAQRGGNGRPLATANRLEAATALHAAQDAMAKAQRAETEQFLQQTPDRSASALAVAVGRAGGAACRRASGHADLLGAARASGCQSEENSPVVAEKKTDADRADRQH